jgi:MoxR-like ATPase
MSTHPRLVLEDLATLTAMETGQLRQMLRNAVPQSRGKFASYIAGSDCVAILNGDRLFTDYQIVLHANGSTQVVVVGAANLSAYTGAQVVPNEPDDPNVMRTQDIRQPEIMGPGFGEAGSVADAAFDSKLERTLSAMEVLDPTAAQIMRAKMGEASAAAQKINAMSLAQLLLQKELDEANKRHKPAETLPLGKGGIVTVCGVDCPVILDPTDPAYVHVPKSDPYFKFEYWTCKRGTSRQNAGDLIKLLLADWRIHLVGPPGVGKTSVFVELGARCNWPVIRVQGDKDYTTDEFLGTKTVTNGNIEFVYGVLAQAMKIGAIFICDEIDYFPADVRACLNPVLEPGGKLLLTNNGGEVIHPHPNFRFVATSNTDGFGDQSGLYPDARVQNAALLSRIGATFHVNWLSKKNEASLLVARTGIDKATAGLIVAVADDTRKAADKDELMYPLTSRHLTKWAEGVGIVGMASAFALCVLNKVPDSDAAVILEISQRHFGDKLTDKTPTKGETDD